MVAYFLYCALFLSAALFSGEFTATVSTHSMPLGQSLTLNLTVKGATPKGTPTLDLPRDSFFIHSQQQHSNTTINNGQVSSSVTWKVTLIPQREGELVIPSISLNTSEGVLSTDPISIFIVKGAPGSDSPSDQEVALTTKVSQAHPYKNEPITYTIRLTSQQSLANIQMEKIQLEDAIVEANGEGKTYERVENGKKVHQVEFSFLITPLKAGPLKIPSWVVQGGILGRRQSIELILQ